MTGAQFFSFRQPTDWDRGTSFHLERRTEGMSIRREKVYRQLARRHFNPPQLSSPIMDTVVDRNGRWYMLDEKGIFWRADLSSNHAEALTTWNGAQWDSWARMAVTEDMIVVLQQGETSMLQAMSADSSQIKWVRDSWGEEPFLGITMAAADDNSLWLLASVASAASLQLLQIGSTGREQGMIELPIDNQIYIADIFQERFELSMGPGQRCWLLDRVTSRVVAIDLEQGLAVMTGEEPLAPSGELLSVCDGGPDGFWALMRSMEGGHRLQRFGLTGEPLERAVLGNGKGAKLMTSRHGIELWDPQERYLYSMQPVSETASWREFGRRIGVWISKALDSGQMETEWHKIQVDAMAVGDTQYNIRYYASDQEELIIGLNRVRLDDYLADESLSPSEKFAALSGLWSKPLRDAEDALLFGAKGRYLWVYLELVGSEHHAPSIRSLKVHFPRESYLRYLPAIYDHQASSGDFLSRYLSLFQTMLEEMDGKIADMPRSLEPAHTGGASLKWLLGWIGIEAEDFWTEDQLRQLLVHAPTLYSMRGTRYAMELLLTIFTGEKPIILEYEQVRPLKENPELGEVSDHLYAADPHTFNVLVKVEHVETDVKRAAIQQLIDAFKPVFATGKLVILQPWVYMDLHSYLGMNTVLSEPTLLTLDGQKSMPHHTITIDTGHDNRMDQHTRLELDSRLE
ncbi:phage tail protein [Paenibacillus sp. 1P07SE]|uniref:phage tail protein n=1 Tax=Paenibacillus sp. 1P07SE TaxID=3132209 RepID=UPI0039A535CF